MMKKKMFVLMAIVCVLMLATACGNQKSEKVTGNADGTQATTQQENTLTGKLDEKKDFMFVVTDDNDSSYEFSIDSDKKPEGYDEVAEGDSVTVTYTGELSEIDPFDGTVISITKAN